MDVLKQGAVWSNAAGQIFFTLGATLGIMTAYGSYAPKNTDMFINNNIIGYVNCGTSVFAGCASDACPCFLSYLEVYLPYCIRIWPTSMSTIRICTFAGRKRMLPPPPPISLFYQGVFVCPTCAAVRWSVAGLLDPLLTLSEQAPNKLRDQC